MKTILLLSCLAALLQSTLCQQGLTSVTGWAEDEDQYLMDMAIYLPKQLAPSPAVVLALHECGLSGPSYFEQANYSTWAEDGGFIIVYPSTLNDTNCWDVSSNKSLTHNGGSQSFGLTQMVAYLEKTYNADPSNVFVTGSSSGCMMTNILVAVYPNIFKAATCYSGVAAGCMAGASENGLGPSTAPCADGDVVKTGAQWAAQVHAMFPEWNGTYPAFQIYHGTSDTTVWYHNLVEELKEWSTIHNVSFSYNVTNFPQANYTKMVYGDGTQLNGFSAVGVGHTVPVHAEMDMEWFGLA